MRRTLALTLAVALLPPAARADPATWTTEIHAEAMSRAPAYRTDGRPKVMVACIEWPGEGGGAPRIQFVVTRVSATQGGGPVPVNRLRRNAMNDCRGRAAGGCDCAPLDESGRNVLRVPQD